MPLTSYRPSTFSTKTNRNTAYGVLRLGVGDRLHITDGRGELHLCEITDANPKRCAVRVVSTEHEFERMPYRLIMAVAPTKNIERFEWFAEKATEVGVSEIIPIECAHSERRIIKREREEKVITAAVKQSLKAYHPLLHDMTPLRKVLDMPFDGRRFIAHCDRARGERVYFPKAHSPGREHHGTDRPRGRLLARRDHGGRRARIRGDHARTPAVAHGNGGRRGHGHGRHRKRRIDKTKVYRE